MESLLNSFEDLDKRMKLLRSSQKEELFCEFIIELLVPLFGVTTLEHSYYPGLEIHSAPTTIAH